MMWLQHQSHRLPTKPIDNSTASSKGDDRHWQQYQRANLNLPRSTCIMIGITTTRRAHDLQQERPLVMHEGTARRLPYRHPPPTHRRYQHVHQRLASFTAFARPSLLPQEGKDFRHHLPPQQPHPCNDPHDRLSNRSCHSIAIMRRQVSILATTEAVAAAATAAAIVVVTATSTTHPHQMLHRHRHRRAIPPCRDNRWKAFAEESDGT
mmetsp:Transcript_22692/g.64258  ORF Transcript_22692/g.64258 Transcript_22692/m.64258 type:complete len:208 (-) Transcript_22692:2306-2929(-)